MNIYLILAIVFAIVFILSILVFIYFIQDEKKLKEVNNTELSNLGKIYSKEEYEKEMFNQYVTILYSIDNEDFNNLKDIVSDSEYNKILLELKKEQEINIKKSVSNIKMEFSKLIRFRIIDDLEVSKLWIKYSCSEEYTRIVDENEQIEKNNRIYEYIITYVRNRTNKEDITCPNCGHHQKLLKKSLCENCDSQIVPKTMHWVYIGKEEKK